MSNKISIIILFIVIFFSNFHLKAQQHFRISSDFSIKEVSENGVKKLTIGRLYYDLNYTKLVLNITFPEEEILIFKDSSIFRIVDNKVVERNTILEGFITNTFYHLLLSNKLSDYGLKDSKFYHKTDIEMVSNQIISEWQPSGGLENITGKIMTLNENKLLRAIIFYDKEGRLIYKQNFNNYEYFSSLKFPSEVIQQYFTKTKDGITELTKKYTYKNIILNEVSNENFYNYRIPIN